MYLPVCIGYPWPVPSVRNSEVLGWGKTASIHESCVQRQCHSRTCVRQSWFL